MENTYIHTLKMLLDISGKTQVELARDIGVSHQAFHAWVSGKSRPSRRHMMNIE